MATTSSSTSTTQTQPTNHTPAHCSSLYNITSRFCGNVPLGTPNRDKLVSHDVNMWLADTLTRIAAKGITDPRLMIREAKLAVSPDVGDATRILNTGRMCNIQHFQVFKDKCLRLRRPPEEKHRYLALQQFLSVKRPDTVGSYISDIEKSRSDIISDMQSDGELMMGSAEDWVASGRHDVLVSLEEILNYISWGIIYQDSAPLWREAFRKIEPKFDSDYIELMSDLEIEVNRLEKSPKIELSAFTDRQDNGVGVVNRQTDNAQGRQDRTHGGARQKTYRGSQGHKSQYRGHSQSTSSGQPKRVECHACGKLGHIAKFCRNTGNTQQRSGGHPRNTHHRTGNNNNRRESGGNRNNNNHSNNNSNGNNSYNRD